MASGPSQTPLCNKERACVHAVSQPRPGRMVLTPRTGRWAATDFPSPSPCHPCFRDRNPLPLPLLHLPITHAQLVPPASARMDAPAPATPGAPRRTLQPHSEGACVCVSQASWPRGTALTLCDPRRSRGNSGSSIILMKDDAWQARVLSLHQGCCRSARGGGGGALVPGTSLLLASCPHQALLNVQEVHAAPMPIGASDRRLPQASVSPPLPLGAGSPGDPGISSVLQSRQERWQL